MEHVSFASWARFPGSQVITRSCLPRLPSGDSWRGSLLTVAGAAAALAKASLHSLTWAHPTFPGQECVRAIGIAVKSGRLGCSTGPIDRASRRNHNFYGFSHWIIHTCSLPRTFNYYNPIQFNLLLRANNQITSASLTNEVHGVVVGFKYNECEGARDFGGSWVCSVAVWRIRSKL